jgi:CBS domain-containing protein
LVDPRKPILAVSKYLICWDCPLTSRDDNVSTAIAKLATGNVHSVLVTDGAKPLGFISNTDIVTALNEEVIIMLTGSSIDS